VISRRSFLRAGLVGGALLGGAALLGRRLTGYTLDAPTAAELRVLSPKEYLILAAAARRILAPDGDDAPAPDTVACALHVDRYLARLPPEVQRDVRALLQLFEHGSAVSTRFTRMTPAQQDATLAAWEASSFTLKRRGFQALRTLAFLGYWRDERTWPLLGYTGPMLPRRL
jgi:hypothetical protein